MANGGNTTAINEVVDPIAIEQFNQLKVSGKELRTELVALLETAIKLNATLGGSTPATFNKNLQASTEATNKIIANNNKQIENEQAKAAKQEQILNKYLVMLSKQEAARQQAEAKQAQRDAKEIAAAEAKAAKIQAIQDRIDKRAEIMFAEPKRSPNPVIMEGGTNLTDEEKNRAFAASSTGMAVPLAKDTAAIEAENAAIAKQRELLAGLSAEYRTNLELLLQLQAERAENTIALKSLSGEDAISSERAVFLTQRQIELKESIRQTNLALSQQTKQMLAEDTSGAQMQARLDELRVAIGSLSEAELANVEIGGVWIAEAIRLDLAIKSLRDSTGDATKHVGNYARAQGTASNATILAEKVSAQFVRQLVRMAAQFLLITVIFGAITALYDWVKGLDVFTGRLDKSKQAWEAWSEVMQDASKNAGAAIIKLEVLNKAAQDVNETEKQRLAAVKALRDLEGDRIKQLSDQAIMTGGLNDKIKELTASLEKQAIAEAGFKKLTDIESKIIDQKTLQGKLEAVRINSNKLIDKGRGNEVGGALGLIPGGDKMGKDFQKNIVNQDIKDQLKDTEDTLKVLENSKNVLERNIGLADLAKAAEDKTKAAKKEGKPKDYGNTDLLESNRIEIEEAKKRNKAIFLDDNYSHEARLVALGQYIGKSKELLDNSAEIIKADTNMRDQQRKNALRKLKLEEYDIDIEALQETENLNKQEVEKRKKALAEIVQATKESEQEQLEVLNQGAIVAAQVLQNARDKAIREKDKQYKDGKISEVQYNKDILSINDQYSIDRLNQELAIQQSILAIREGKRDSELILAKQRGATPEELSKIKSDANKGIDSTNNKIAEIGGQLANAYGKQDQDNTKGDKKTSAEKRKELQEALGYAVDVTKDINDLIDKGYENQISKLEKIGQKIQENADIEKAAIGRSLDTQLNKARREEILAAETASKQKAIQQEIAKEKHKQAVADKVAAIAEIILNTAIAASKALTAGPILGIPLEAVVIALGAIQLAKVAATPIPQFAKGTGLGGHKGGLAIVGEVGPERITEPGRPAYYSPGVATMMSLPRGTVVEPYKMLPETPKWTASRSDNAGVIDGLNRVERAVSGQKRGNTQLSGWVQAQRQADAWNGYVGRKFK